MTDLLTRVLHERADSAPGPHFDVDAIVRAGDNRIRRSRVHAGVAALAVAGVVAAAGLAGTQLLSPASPGPATEAVGRFADRLVGFADGSVIHYGDRTFTVDAPIASYVQTDDGFVYTTADGDAWFFDGTASTRIGRAAGHRLRADDTGSLVAWLTGTPKTAEQYVVYDTSLRTEVSRVDAAGVTASADDSGPSVYAVDDGAVYWHGAAGIERYQVATGTSTDVATWPTTSSRPQASGGPRELVDVANGRLAYVVEGDQGSRLLVGDTVGPGAQQMPTGWHGVLSPDGRYIGVEEADEVAVYDTRSGSEVTPDLAGYPFKVVYGWEDADTAMVFAITDLKAARYPAEFLRCDVPAGDCTVVSSATVTEQGFSLPVGDGMS